MTQTDPRHAVAQAVAQLGLTAVLATALGAVLQQRRLRAPPLPRAEGLSPHLRRDLGLPEPPSAPHRPGLFF